jgi:hypothetical protein
MFAAHLHDIGAVLGVLSPNRKQSLRPTAQLCVEVPGKQGYGKARSQKPPRLFPD